VTKIKYIQVIIFTSLTLLIAVVRIGAEEEKGRMLADKVYFSFKEEKKTWDKWLEKNPIENRHPSKANPLWPIYLKQNEYYHSEVEKELADYYRDTDFFLIYFERNIDNGTLNTTLFVNKCDLWIQIDWRQISVKNFLPQIEVTKQEIADFDEELCRRAMKHRFYVGIDKDDYWLFGGTEVYIHIFDQNKIGRFAFYGSSSAHPVYGTIKQLLGKTAMSDNEAVEAFR